MKIVKAIFFALALPCLLAAQSNISETYDPGNLKKVYIEFLHGDVKIEKHSGSEIVLEGSVMVNDEDGSKYFDIKAKKVGSTFRIISEADFSDADQRMTIIKTDGTKIFKKGRYSINKVEKGEGIESINYGVNVDADFTIKVPSDMNVEIDNTYGGVEVQDYWKGMKIHSTYGSVDAILSEVPASPEMQLSSTYSSVDLSIPESINAALSLTTGYGKVFTDIDFDPEYREQGKSCEFGQDIKGKLNSGTGSIKLDATYSNVYLRKSVLK